MFFFQTKRDSTHGNNSKNNAFCGKREYVKGENEKRGGQRMIKPNRVFQKRNTEKGATEKKHSRTRTKKKNVQQNIRINLKKKIR